MMSQTHILLSSALFSKPGHSLRNAAIVVGAFIPDLAIFALFGWSKAAGIAEQTVWNELYWREPWQSWAAAGNSLPLYITLGLIGVILLRIAGGVWRIGLVLAFIALSASLHIAGDLPVHVQDAHRHLWPLSDWKFISPISYWNPAHHGTLFAIFEICLGLLLAIVLFRRFQTPWLRVTLGLVIALYIAVPLYFTFMLGGA
ncbi:hypothetical protein ACFQ14_08240 [Pseudahrensia aquimaris]|uniref:Cobalamin biosynthesis protein CobQ n=1 Tax=Pseudahrensia aquimaris TaxID=744461 RepID=A0ABW3FJS1_9HYPH